MSDGWGQDFDEDGNVIGTVPDSDPSFFEEHKYKLVATFVAIFALTLPGTANSGAGGLVGSTMVSAFIAALLVGGYVKIRG